MPKPDLSAPGGREAAQENYAKPGDKANTTKNNHGQQGQAQQNNLVYQPAAREGQPDHD